MASNNTIILTGGAGYIGKCTATHLIDRGYRIILIDDFSTSKHLKDMPFECIEVDLTDRKALRKAWASLPKPSGVIHFAARALVPESCQDPALYFRVNLGAANNIAELIVETPGCRLVHSSSCAVYGIPERLPLREDSRLEPASPYGESKRMAEVIFSHFQQWRGLGLLNLRYFNPGGAIQWKNTWFGEDHDPETHLIPRVLAGAAKNEVVQIFGTDYPTPDGTCVRDFIHIEDLARAHALALDLLFREKPENIPRALNLGAGTGVSVRQVIQAAEGLLGKKLKVQEHPRRPGDPAEIRADIGLAQRTLKWKPERSLKDILASHLQYRKSLS